jgi:cobalt/nickel transport system permease protein
MHMADALVSPAVGGAFWAVTAATIAICSDRVRKTLDDRKVPLMGVLAAFVFAAQMINFTIPATGSSGHLGGGLLLSILLGPSAGFLSIASVLMIQALFFADGGLLALGCNIFNLGFFPAFLAYPLIYKKIIGHSPSQSRMVFAAILASVFALQCGSIGVVMQTTLSGVSSLPLETFLFLMQPIHLAIGIVEGVVTALVVSFIYRARPDILDTSINGSPSGTIPIRSLFAFFFVAAVFIGGILSWFASEHPDGLEWSISKITGSSDIPSPDLKAHETLQKVQEKTSLLPDYALPEGVGPRENERVGKSLSGIIGGILTLFVCMLVAIVLRRKKD